jgi:hypothetical protein
MSTPPVAVPDRRIGPAGIAATLRHAGCSLDRLPPGQIGDGLLTRLRAVGAEVIVVT